MQNECLSTVPCEQIDVYCVPGVLRARVGLWCSEKCLHPLLVQYVYACRTTRSDRICSVRVKVAVVHSGGQRSRQESFDCNNASRASLFYFHSSCRPFHEGSAVRHSELCTRPDAWNADVSPPVVAKDVRLTKAWAYERCRKNTRLPIESPRISLPVFLGTRAERRVIRLPQHERSVFGSARVSHTGRQRTREHVA